MTYEEEIKISYDFFDSIDFTKFTKSGERMTLQEIIDDVDEYYDNHPDLLPEVFQGYVFNFVGDYELGEYLQQRYGWKQWTEVVEQHYIIPE